MVSVGAGITVMSVNVSTSDGGGLTADQITDLAMDKILNVANTAPEPIRDQAIAFQENIRTVLKEYIDLAGREERATIAQKIREAGQQDLADFIRRI
jgi:lysyl-tRNA synthetase class I